MHFTTPWITVAEERKGAAQRFLWRLTLRLSGRGDMIMAARWEPAEARWWAAARQRRADSANGI